MPTKPFIIFISLHSYVLLCISLSRESFKKYSYMASLRLFNVLLILLTKAFLVRFEFDILVCEVVNVPQCHVQNAEAARFRTVPHKNMK